MNKLAGYLLTPVHYILFGVILCVFHPIQWISLKLGGYKTHKRSVDILNLCILSTYLVVGARIRFNNPHKLPEGHPIIFVANHQSMYDIPPLIWFLRRHHAKFISKIELSRGIPSISFNLKHGGAANIDRNDSKQAVAEILTLSRRMHENKWSAVIFPEGTRARSGRLKPFAAGGLATLLKKCPEAMIVPVAIKDSWKLVQYGSFPLSFGEKISWTVLKPIDTSGKSVEETVEEVREAIRVVVES